MVDSVGNSEVLIDLFGSMLQPEEMANTMKITVANCPTLEQNVIASSLTPPTSRLQQALTKELRNRYRQPNR